MCPKCRGGVEPSTDIIEEETVLEDDPLEKVGTVLTAGEDMEAYAVGDEIWDEVSRLYYKVTGDGEVEVKGQEQGDRTANLSIPESVEKDGVTYRVTSIRSGAFRKNSFLKSVVIPASVRSIGESAFEQCPLTSVTIAEGVTNIGAKAFEYCSYLRAIVIPGSVKSVGNDAFGMCEDLVGVTMGEGLQTIGDNAFLYCTSLPRVEIPKGVTSIGDSAFGMCTKLTSVTIPESVTIIREGAFAWSGLTSLEIPGGVTRIEMATFEGCKQLTSVTIPKGVTSIGRNAFYGCENLTAVEIPQGVTKIEQATFYKCRKLTSVEIPQLVASIGDYAFDSCTGLSHIEIPENVRSIGAGSFGNCSSLTSITISTNTSKIGKEAFKDCNQLKALNLVVSPDEAIQFPQVGQDAFAPFPDQDHKRYLYFYDSYDTSRDKLTGQAYEDAFAEVAKNDGDSDNSRWYGWSYEGYTAPIVTYIVTINVKKDGQSWSGHSRTFALLNSGDGSFITDENPAAESSYSIGQVPDGTYTIYDVTGVPADSLSSRAANTRVGGTDTTVTVTVNGADTEAEINYYTATFYDGTNPYGEDTKQKPQIILRGKQVSKPDEDPTKEDKQFTGWKTQPDGSTAYDFNKAMTDTTGIYASWADDTKPVITYTITATAGEGGSISPAGTVAVVEGDTQQFTVTPNEGYRVKAVTVDGRDATADLTGSVTREESAAAKNYTFINVTQNHTIHAAFENTDTPPDDGDEPGDDEPDDDKPGEETPDDGKKPGVKPEKSKGKAKDTKTVVVEQAAPLQVENKVIVNPPALKQAEDKVEPPETPDEKEPKTGDTTPIEIYATVAMIAGLTYLLLYFMEEGRGMTEREKEVFVAAFIRWAKKGGRFRRGCAIAAIFCLLVYYHSIGKRAGRNLNRECLKRAV